MSQVTLAYSCKPGIPALLPRVTARMAATHLFCGELDELGMRVLSDATVQGVDAATRTIVLYVEIAGEQRFPTVEAKKYATIGLYTQSLAAHIPGKVHGALPVVS